LPRKVLYLAVGERYEIVTLKEVEDALPQKVHDDADMSAVVEAVSEMDATVAVFLVVGLQCTQDTEFDLASIAVFLDRANNLDGNAVISSSPVNSLDDLAKGALS
jgi:lactam utilization protein B